MAIKGKKKVREKTSIEKESQKEGKGWWSGSSVRP
jgi:hypothetical protein